MPIVSEKYPDKLSELEIKKILRGYQKEILEKRGQINTVLQFAPLVQLGLYELNNRSQEKITRISLLISFIAITISIIAIMLSIQSGVTTDSIMREQLQVLGEIKSVLLRFN